MVRYLQEYLDLIQESFEVEQKKPRQTGSLVAHNDDIVTRMKNIELIELGRYRIKPWYFSPYPEVRNRKAHTGKEMLLNQLSENIVLSSKSIENYWDMKFCVYKK